MPFTKKEKEALFAEFEAQIAAQNKGDVEAINKLITEKLGRIDALEKKLQGSQEDPEAWKDRRPFREGMKTDDVDPGGLVFLDDSGKEHKALKLNEKLYEGKEEDFSVGKIIRARILGDLKGLNDYETKQASEGIGAAGGWLISEAVSARIIQKARNQMCVQRAGAITIPMETAELRLVRIVTDPTSAFYGENETISESDWSLAPINLKAQTLGCLVRSSIALLEDAKNAGSQLEEAMAASIALEMDRVSILGDGVNEPRGILNCDDVHVISMGTNGAALTSYDEFSNSVEDIAESNGIPNAVIMAPRTAGAIDRLKEGTTNAPLPGPESYKNLTKYVTNQIPITDTKGTSSAASRAYIGDFKNVVFGVRKALEVIITREGGTDVFSKVQALIRCRVRMDIGILRENHFCIVEGIIPA